MNTHAPEDYTAGDLLCLLEAHFCEISPSSRQMVGPSDFQVCLVVDWRIEGHKITEHQQAVRGYGGELHANKNQCLNLRVELNYTSGWSLLEYARTDDRVQIVPKWRRPPISRVIGYWMHRLLVDIWTDWDGIMK